MSAAATAESITSTIYAANHINNEVKENALSFVVENDALLGYIVRANAFTCVKTTEISFVVEQRDHRTLEWKFLVVKTVPGMGLESEQSTRIPLGLSNLGVGLYRVSIRNVLTQAGRGACGTRRADWLPVYQTETIIFAVDAAGVVGPPKTSDIHRILAFDGIAYLDKVARFAVVAPEPFLLTLYQEFGKEKFVFRQVLIEDVLAAGQWSQLTIDRFFPSTFRDNLPVKYTMTGSRSGVTVFGIFAPPI